MAINKELLPIKIHFGLFMAAVGPILPFAAVIGKQVGLSEIEMGTMSGLLPLIYLLVKPLYGYAMDYFHKMRSCIFVSSVLTMGLCFLLICFVPPPCDVVALNQTCTLNISAFLNESTTDCNHHCSDEVWKFFYKPWTFWFFVVFMSMGLVMFNVCNSSSDAICFGILGDEKSMMYGHQRVYGTVGYGITAFLSGYLVDKYSESSVVKNETPSFILLAIFLLLDVVVCFKLKINSSVKSSHILKDASGALQKPNVTWFLFFAVMFGVCDSYAVYFLFWYLEDVSKVTGTNDNIRSIEGLITLLQTFFGEVIFFRFSGEIIQKLGYSNCFTLCFFGYFARFAMLSFIPSVWWALPIEVVMQGVTYALSYTLIVSYANHISTPGIRVTMQSVTTAMYDGLGYSVGSFVGGLLYKFYNGRNTFLIFSLFAGLSTILNFIVFRKKVAKSDTAEEPRAGVELEKFVGSNVQISK